MDYETLLFKIRNQLAFIQLNRPESGNSLNLQMTNELMDAAIHCDSDSEIRVVLICSSGKMFCVGGDLNDFSNSGDQVSTLTKQMTTSFHAVISRFARLWIPVVCAVNGTAAGGGMSFVLVADMGPRSRISQVHYGLYTCRFGS